MKTAVVANLIHYKSEPDPSDRPEKLDNLLHYFSNRFEPLCRLPSHKIEVVLLLFFNARHLLFVFFDDIPLITLLISREKQFSPFKLVGEFHRCPEANPFAAHKQ